jgi:putative transposase
MKRRFTEEQIIAVLREAESGTPVKDLCRRVGVRTVTFYKWKSKYAGMEISEVRRMRLLEDENARLKKIVAQQALDIDALKGGAVKKVVGPRAEREAARVAREEVSRATATLRVSTLVYAIEPSLYAK